MKIAVTSKGKDLDSQIDPRFGRAAFLIIVDPESLEFEVIDNASNVNAFKGAGIQAASSVSEKGAELLITGFCGPNAFRTLDAAKIRVLTYSGGTVREAINEYKQGNLSSTEAANVEGHW